MLIFASCTEGLLAAEYHSRCAHYSCTPHALIWHAGTSAKLSSMDMLYLWP
jgi:hypothetical protein